MNRRFGVRTTVFLIAPLGIFLNMGACPQNSTTTNTPNDNGTSNDNGSTDDSPNDNDNSSDDGQSDGDQNDGAGELFASITGTEILVEGSDSQPGDGTSRTRDERFTSTFTLTRLDAEFCGQVFVGDVLADKTCGNLQGSAHLTYSESGTNLTPELDCPTENYAGEVEWDVDLTGTYTILPSIGLDGQVVYDTITIDVAADSVSSPEYQVRFTYPGCAEFDSQSPSNYFWAGPGEGTFTLEAIVIVNGVYDGQYDNPFEDDLGELDYYEIHVQTSASP